MNETMRHERITKLTPPRKLLKSSPFKPPESPSSVSPLHSSSNQPPLNFSPLFKPPLPQTPFLKHPSFKSLPLFNHSLLSITPSSNTPPFNHPFLKHPSFQSPLPQTPLLSITSSSNTQPPSSYSSTDKTFAGTVKSRVARWDSLTCQDCVRCCNSHPFKLFEDYFIQHFIFASFQSSFKLEILKVI